VKSNGADPRCQHSSDNHQPDLWRYLRVWKDQRRSALRWRHRSRQEPTETARRWLALHPGTHEGYVGWERLEAIRRIVSDNTPEQPTSRRRQTGQRAACWSDQMSPLRVQTDDPLHRRKAHIPRYSCSRGWLNNGEPRCIAFGGLRVDDAIEAALLKVVEPGALSAAIEPDAQEVARRDEVRDALIRDLEAMPYAADRAFRLYDAADPANRLVAAELELRWNRALTRVSEMEARIAAHDRAAPPWSELSASSA
jgi:hypothetical protein